MKKEPKLIKHDTEENWNKAVNFIPQDGEMIMYDGILENGKYVQQPKFKIGDGKTKVKDLDFIQFQTRTEYHAGTLKI